MKSSIDFEKILGYLNKYKKYFLAVVVILIFATVSFGVYRLLVPVEDPETVRKEQEEIKTFDITFDKSALQELASRKSPSKINENGGRNPFLPF